MKTGLINKTVIVIFVTVVFYGIIISVSDLETIKQRIVEVNFWYLPVIVSLEGLQMLIGAIKYHRLLQRSEIDISFKQSLRLYMIGRFMGITPGGAGVVIKSHLLKKYHGIPVSLTFPIIIVERWIEVLAVLVLATSLLIWADIYESKIILAIGYLVFFLSLAIIYHKGIYAIFQKLGNKINYLKKYANKIDESRDSLIRITTKKSFAEAFGYSIASKIIQLGIIYLCFISVGMNLDVMTAGLIYYTGMIVGILTLIPGGIIVAETSMIGLLLKSNVGLAIATLGVLYVRIITVWGGTIVGIASSRFVFKEETTR